jgi:hypothetical protein
LSKTLYPAAFAGWAWIKNSITGDENFEDTESALWEFYKRELNDAFGLFRDDFLEFYGVQIPPPIANVIRTMNPFTWMWDDIKEGLDWFTKGGLRTLLQKLWNEVQGLFGGEIPTEIPTEITRPSLPNVVFPTTNPTINTTQQSGSSNIQTPVNSGRD